MSSLHRECWPATDDFRAYGISSTPAGKLGVKALGSAYKNTNVNQITNLEAIATHFPLFFCQGAPYHSLLSSGVCLLSLNDIFSRARKDNKHAPCILQKGAADTCTGYPTRESGFPNQQALQTYSSLPDEPPKSIWTVLVFSLKKKASKKAKLKSSTFYYSKAWFLLCAS